MKQHTPPKWATKIIKWYSHPDFVNEIIGDMEEMYHIWRNTKGPFIAGLLYFWNSILFLRAYNNKLSGHPARFNQLSMIKHSVKLSIRNIRKYKVYSLGNILGLAIGISTSLLIYFHIDHELGFEKDFPKHERIFRVSSSETWAQSPPSFAEEFKPFFPEVEETVRLARYGGYRSTCTVGTGEKQFLSNGIFQTDESIYEVFDLELRQGTSYGSLTRPYTVVLTESIAKKIFNDDSPIGQFLTINDGDRKFEVTGVITDFPEQTHIKAEILMSMATFYDQIPEEWTSSRGWMVMHTYFLLKESARQKRVQERMYDFAAHYFDQEIADEMEETGRFFEVMNIGDIHLKSDRTGEMEANSDITYIYIFATLAVFILIIVSVNFINIFTTLAFKRIKEIGLRKIVGADRKQLIYQLLGESCVTSLIAAVLGIALCIIFLPSYNNLTDLNISWNELLAPANIGLVSGASLLLGLLSGTYPALLITRQNLADTVVKHENPKASISFFRKSLIVFQFSLSLFILISTVVVNLQMDFIKKKDLGFDTSQLVSTVMYGDLGHEIRANYRSFFAQLEQHPDIQKVSMTSNVAGESLSREYFRPVELDPETEYENAHMLWADENFLSIMDIELTRGRNFSVKTDTSAVFLVSEKLMENWGEDALGKMAEYRDQKGPVIGVFKDINFYSLHSELEPIVICLRPSWSSKLVIKISSEDPIKALDFVEARLQEKSPNAIVQFRFLDDQLQQLYAEEDNMFFVFKAFSVLALIISCLGLLGIAAIEVQRRTKEVGIRKVLGASASEILMLLSKQFSFILLIAIVIGIPVSYYSSMSWLANYSYRITLSAWEFIWPSIALVIVALLVVSLHSIKAMRSNPTESLRSE